MNVGAIFNDWIDHASFNAVFNAVTEVNGTCFALKAALGTLLAACHIAVYNSAHITTWSVLVRGIGNGRKCHQ